MSKYICIKKFTRTNVWINICWKLYEYSNCFKYYNLTHSGTNIRIYSYKQIWHEWMSEYIHKRKIDTNECLNKYLWPIYSNIWIYPVHSDLVYREPKEYRTCGHPWRPHAKCKSGEGILKKRHCPVVGCSWCPWCSWWSCWPLWPWWQGLTFSLPPPPFYSYDSSFIMPRLPHGKANDGKPLFITWRCDLLLWYWMLLRLRMPSQVREGFFKVDSHTSYLTDARMAMQSIYWLKATTKAILILLREFLAPVDLKTLFSFPRYSHLKMPEGTNHISIAYFRGW